MTRPARIFADPSGGVVPRWVLHSMKTLSSIVTSTDSFVLQQRTGPRVTLLQAVIPDEPAMDDCQFKARTFEAYAAIFAALNGLHPVRFWNFLPDIHRRNSNDRDRYQLFNSGRFAAFDQQYRGRSNFPATLATASAVGHAVSQLTIHCLATDRPGEPIDNPAQVRPYEYSRQYGSQPPCFARSTLVRGERVTTTLLVGGTASILGEMSLYSGDLQRQTQQTLENLSTVVRASGIGGCNHRTPLASFTQLRVYHRHAADIDCLRQLLAEKFVNVENIEFVHADICRRELLVEIEGVAGDPFP